MDEFIKTVVSSPNLLTFFFFFLVALSMLAVTYGAFAFEDKRAAERNLKLFLQRYLQLSDAEVKKIMGSYTIYTDIPDLDKLIEDSHRRRIDGLGCSCQDVFMQ